MKSISPRAYAFFVSCPVIKKAWDNLRKPAAEISEKGLPLPYVMTELM